MSENDSDYNLSSDTEAVKMLAAWMRSSSFTVVLTGAGCSVDSGVPDFRSKNGWWRQIDPRTVATVEAMERDYSLFHSFYSMRLEKLKETKPHAGHYAIGEWERLGYVQTVATQNVDGLHQLAGSRNVLELHGAIRSVRCRSCGQAAGVESFLQKETCTSCGSPLRPGVVLFGESLPEGTWEQALADIRRAELVIVIGTSLEVYPVNRLPFLTSGRTAIVNLDETGEDSRFGLIVRGRAVDVLSAVDEALQAMD